MIPIKFQPNFLPWSFAFLITWYLQLKVPCVLPIRLVSFLVLFCSWSCLQIDCHPSCQFLPVPCLHCYSWFRTSLTLLRQFRLSSFILPLVLFFSSVLCTSARFIFCVWEIEVDLITTAKKRAITIYTKLSAVYFLQPVLFTTYIHQWNNF